MKTTRKFFLTRFFLGRPFKHRLATLTAMLAVSVTLSSCGGGGGGGGETNTAPAPSIAEACNNIDTRIINGSQCAGTSTPVVSVEVKFPGGNSAQCTGVVIAPTAVLTAGHCFLSSGFFFNGGNFFFTGADADVIAGGQRVSSSSIEVHPQFNVDANALAIFFDVAIIRTPTALNAPSFPVLGSREVTIGEGATIAGFGLDENNVAGQLRAGSMVVTARSSNHIFADFTGELSNTCEGDSGGPFLVQQGEGFAVAGTTSSGLVLECTAGDTSLFANLANADILQFILDLVPETQVV